MTQSVPSYEEQAVNSADILVPCNSYQRRLSVSRANRITNNFDEHITSKPKVSCAQCSEADHKGTKKAQPAYPLYAGKREGHPVSFTGSGGIAGYHQQVRHHLLYGAPVRQAHGGDQPVYSEGNGTVCGSLTFTE